MRFPISAADKLIKEALAEDVGEGDLTSHGLFVGKVKARAKLRRRDLEHLFNVHLPLHLPANPRLASVNWTPQTVRFVWVERRPWREHLPDLIQLIWDRKIDPGKVFDLTLPLERAAEGYRAMDERTATKVLLTV